jgi:hypothetical protein
MSEDMTNMNWLQLHILNKDQGLQHIPQLMVPLKELAPN